MDTWLGDVNMWRWKGSWLGPAGPTGKPRLYEQFMLSVIDFGFADVIIPVQISASVGLRYLMDRTGRGQGKIPRPSVTYIDAAHEYPETYDEITQAWQLLAPGGFLVGDDYVGSWPGVIRSVNEFIAGTRVAHPTSYACAWAAQQRVKFGLLRTIDLTRPGDPPETSMLLIDRGTWIVRKPLDGPAPFGVKTLASVGRHVPAGRHTAREVLKCPAQSPAINNSTAQQSSSQKPSWRWG